MRDDTADALDAVTQAEMVVDAAARAQHANRAAAALLRDVDRLDADAAGLRAECSKQTRALQALVAQASGADRLGGSMVLDRPGAGGRHRDRRGVRAPWGG